MSPEIRLGEHAGCGGIEVIVPSGSVYGGTVSFCIKCQDERIKAQRKIPAMTGDPSEPGAPTRLLSDAGARIVRIWCDTCQLGPDLRLGSDVHLTRQELEGLARMHPGHMLYVLLAVDLPA